MRANRKRRKEKKDKNEKEQIQNVKVKGKWRRKKHISKKRMQ